MESAFDLEFTDIEVNIITIFLLKSIKKLVTIQPIIWVMVAT